MSVNMKKLKFSLIVLLLNFIGSVNAQQYVTINSLNGYSITCSTTTINLVASHTFSSAPVNFVWTLPNNQTITGGSINATTPGIYYLTGTSPNAMDFDSLVIGINTLAPTSALSPSFQNINCNPASVITVTLSATNPTNNVNHNIISAFGSTLVANTNSVGFQPFGAGIYTYALVNNQNGCATYKSFTVTSTQGYPTYSLQSSAGIFTLGCQTTSVLTLSILGANTSSPSGGPVTYSILPPGSPTLLPQTGTLSSQASYSINSPGTYTVVVRDNITLCDSRSAISVIQNTTPPTYVVHSSLPNKIMNCNSPSLTLTAITSSATLCNWSVPNSSSTTSGTVVNTFISSSTSNSVNGSYLLNLTDPVNLCSTNTAITVFQNIYQPNVVATATQSVITCPIPTVVLVNQSTTGIPSLSFPNSQPVVAKLWTAPAPQNTLAMSSTYTANAGGVYTLLAQDLNNGCTNTTTISIGDTRILPEVSEVQAPYTLLCPGGNVVLSSGVGTNSTNLIYLWAIPPGATANFLTGSTITVSYPGTYSVTVTNTITGCAKTVTVSVWACVGLNETGSEKKLLNLYPNPGHGNYTIEIKGNAHAEILNVLGEVIFKTSFREGSNSLDLSQFANGLYLVRLRSENSQETVQLLKQ